MPTPQEITDLLAATYHLTPPLVAQRIDHGGWNQIYRVSGADGAWALRVSHRHKQRQQLAFELALLAALAPHLPFIPAVQRTAGGALYGAVAGTFCTLFRWLPGSAMTLNEVAIERAGFALGQIHGALAPLTPRHRYVSDLSLLAFDWTDNTLARGDVLAAPGAALPAVLAAELDLLRAARRRLDRWLQQCRRQRRFVAGIIHGDFYPGNLLAGDGAITAVLDWDEVTTSWTAYEVANAVWEFARDDDRAVVDAHRRALFLNGYAAAFPLPLFAAADEARLIAVRRLIELQHAFFEIRAGRTADLDYAVLNLRFLKGLLGQAG